MGRFFEQLFSIEVLHDYYVSGKSHDFILTPTADTLRRAKGLRLLLKTKVSFVQKGATAKLIAVQESVDGPGAPLLPIATPEKFRFAIHLANPSLPNYTVLLPAKNNNAEIYYYSNPSGNTLAQEVMELHPRIFTYRFNFPGAVTELRVKNPDGQLIAAMTTALSGGPDYEVPFNLAGYTDGRYTIELYNGPALVDTRFIYSDQILSRQGVFGIIEITKSDNVPQDFIISLTSRPVKWKYFVVLRDGDDPANYSVLDTGIGPVTFNSVPPNTSDIQVIAALKEQVPGAEVGLFESATDILFSETVRPDIQLIKSGAPPEILVHNLPNAPVQKPAPDIFVYV